MKTLDIIVIVSLLASILSPFLFFYFADRILITEIVPLDQKTIQKPNFGDNVEVYGPWINDRHSFLPDWNEIHPVRYIKNLKTGEEWGNKNYSGELMQGVHNPSRLRIFDENDPYRIARGTVVDVFDNPEDGDWHIHLLLDDDYQYLTKSRDRPFMYIPVFVLFGVPIGAFLISLFVWIYRKKLVRIKNLF